MIDYSGGRNTPDFIQIIKTKINASFDRKENFQRILKNDHIFSGQFHNVKTF